MCAMDKARLDQGHSGHLNHIASHSRVDFGYSACKIENGENITLECML